MRDIFSSELRHGDDLGAFFEADDDTSYFYLIDLQEPEGCGIKGAVPILGLPDDLKEADVHVWVSSDQEAVGLFIAGRLVAAFEFHSQLCFALDASDANRHRAIPDWAARRFRTH